MTTLPQDISRCVNESCPLKRNCLRYLSPSGSKYQVISDFKTENGKCKHQIKLRHNEDS